jgi:hypothetical protein
MPARHDPSASHVPSKTEVEDTVELFEHATDEDLKRLVRERRNFPDSGEKRKNLWEDQFVVLDERSASDKTVLLYAERRLYGDCWEMVDGVPIDKEAEVITEGWWVWRVRFDACK